MLKVFRRLRFLINIRKSIPFLIEFFLSGQVPFRDKAVSVGLILAYLAFPFDVIPDFLVFFGILDDVAVLTWVLQRVVRIAPKSLKDKYQINEIKKENK